MAMKYVFQNFMSDADDILNRFRYFFPIIKALIPYKYREFLREKIRNYDNCSFYSEITGETLIEEWPHENPLISVIIPCYNYGNYLGDALQSVLRSTFQNFEIIIINDGSTDKYTLQILDTIRGSKVRIIHQSNQGLVTARNNGIEVARGKYICCLDADDTLEPTYIEKCIEILESEPGVGFVYSWVRLFGDRDGIWYTRNFKIERLLKYNYISVSAIFRKEVWEKRGGYNRNMIYGYEDWDFWLSISELGMKGFLIQEVLFNHRRHGKTMTHEARKKNLFLISQIRKNHTALYKKDFIKKIIKGYRDLFVKNYAINTLRQDQYILKKRRRILFLLPWITVGGSESVCLEILRGLKDNFDFFIITTLPCKNEWHEKFYKYTKYIYNLPFFLRKCYWKSFVLNFIQIRGIDTVIISNSHFGYEITKDIRSMSSSIKILSILHNDSYVGHIEEAVRNISYFNNYVCVSERVKESLLRKYSVRKEMVHVVYNTVDSKSVFNPELYKNSTLLAELKLPKNKKLILWIGRFSEEKLPLDFVKIARKMQGDLDIFFAMFGGGPLEGAIRKESRFLKNFRLFYFCNKIPELLFHAHSLILTSRIEGFPIVVLEAQAMGIPVIVTDVGDVKKVIQDGKNGYIVHQGDVQDIISKIYAINNIRRDDIRDSFLKKFPLDDFLEKYRSIIS